MPKQPDFEKHVATGGLECPWCASLDVQTTGHDFQDAGLIRFYWLCEQCSETWSEDYKLVSACADDQ